MCDCSPQEKQGIEELLLLPKVLDPIDSFPFSFLLNSTMVLGAILLLEVLTTNLCCWLITLFSFDTGCKPQISPIVFDNYKNWTLVIPNSLAIGKKSDVEVK